MDERNGTIFVDIRGNDGSENTCQEAKRVKEMLKKLFKDERGQDLMEYGLLAAFISIVALVVIKDIGPLIVPFYTSVENALTP